MRGTCSEGFEHVCLLHSLSRKKNPGIQTLLILKLRLALLREGGHALAPISLKFRLKEIQDMVWHKRLKARGKAKDQATNRSKASVEHALFKVAALSQSELERCWSDQVFPPGYLVQLCFLCGRTSQVSQSVKQQSMRDIPLLTASLAMATMGLELAAIFSAICHQVGHKKSI